MLLFGFLAVFIVLVVFVGPGFRVMMRSFGALTGGVDGIGRLGDGGHGFGKSLGMRFEGGGLLRLGNGLGADRCDRRGRLAGMIVVVMIVLVVMAMVVMIVRVMVLAIMGMMVIIVLMIVMPVIMVMMIVVVTFVLAVMLGIGVQVLALMRGALGMLRQGLALDRLAGRIGAEALDDVAADAFALTAAAGLRWRERRRPWERFSLSSSASRWACSSASISACRSATGIW